MKHHSANDIIVGRFFKTASRIPKIWFGEKNKKTNQITYNFFDFLIEIIGNQSIITLSEIKRFMRHLML